MFGLRDRFAYRIRPVKSGHGYSPVTVWDRVDDVQILAGMEVRRWKQMMDDLANGGGPVALSGGIAGAEANPLADALANLTLSASELAAYTAATFAPIRLPIRAPVHYVLFLSWTLTTPAGASQTLTLTPRIGTSASGASLGASNAMALTASITGTFWQLEGEVTVRATGSGTNARAYGSFDGKGKAVTAGAGTPDVNTIFGYTAATFDSQTADQALWTGVTGTAAGQTFALQQIRFGSWN